MARNLTSSYLFSATAFAPILITLLAVSASPQNAGPLIFLPAFTYDSGGLFASSVTMADVNDDGKLDLLVANYGSNSVGVLLGNGDGTFRPVVTYDSGGISSTSVAVADVDGDGKLDVLVANYFSNTVGVLLGNGDGTFRKATTFGAGGAVWSLAVADVNGDGHPDLLVAYYGSHSVGVLLGNGNGTFQTVVIYDSGGLGTLSIAVADVNGDGKSDVLVSNASSLTVGVLFGNGDGTFQSAVTYDSGGTAQSIAVADVNGDGKLDVLVSNASSGTVGVLLGNGNGTFQPVVTYDTHGTSGSMAVEDVNGDGNPDIVIAGGSTIGLLLGKGDGTFLPVVTYESGSAFTQSIAIGDINGDGKPDLAVASYCLVFDGSRCVGNGTLGVLLNNNGTPPTTTSLVSSVNPANFNQLVTYTATVAGKAEVALSGTVTFIDGAAEIATVALVNNQATYSTSYSKTVSTHAITAAYSGKFKIAEGSVSTTLTEHVRGTTRTGETTSGTPSFVGQPVTFTATVRSKYGVIPDGEMVTFYDATTALALASVKLAGGRAVFTTSALSGQRHYIEARYSGDVSLAPSFGAVTQIVNKYPTTTTLTSHPNPSNFGRAVTFTAHVTGTGPNAPKGKVRFRNGTMGATEVTLSSGIARLTTSTLAVGMHPITAEYLSDASNAESTSSVLDQVVK